MINGSGLGSNYPFIHFSFPFYTRRLKDITAEAQKVSFLYFLL